MPSINLTKYEAELIFTALDKEFIELSDRKYSGDSVGREMLAAQRIAEKFGWNSFAE